MISWRFSLRAIRSRPARTVLTVLSIVIGVAAVVAVSLATTTTRAALADIFTTLTGRASLEIVARGGGPFDQRAAPFLEQIDGVQAAVPVVQRQSIMYLGEDRKVQLTVLGIDPSKDKIVRDYQLMGGRLLDESDTAIVLDAALARSLNLELGSEVKLLTRAGLKKTSVVGLISPRGASAVGKGVLYMPLGLAQKWFRVGRRVDAVQILLSDGADENAVFNSIQEQLPKGITIRRPSSRTQLADETMLSTEMGLQLARSFIVVLGVFIILNTLQMSVAERRRQFAIMRAIGATRRQIALILYREALLIGLVGTLLGMLVGLAGAAMLTQATEHLLAVSLPTMSITPRPFVLAAVVGLGISLVGTFLPARKAARLSPLEGMKALTSSDTTGPPRLMPIFGLGIVIASLATMGAAVYGWLPIELVVDSGIVAVVGLVLIVPLLLRPLMSLFGWLLNPLLRVEGRLARRQLLRHRGRTTLTVGVLFVALSTGIGLANSIMDNVNDVRNWYRNTIVGDFFVRAAMMDMNTGLAANLPDDMYGQVAAIPGVQNVEAARFVSTDVSDEKAILVIREFTTTEATNFFQLQEGSADNLQQQLFAGEVVVGSVLAHRLQVHAGDSISLPVSDGEVQLRVAAITNEYMAGGLTIHMERQTAKRLLGVDGADALVVTARPEALAQVESKLQELCAQRGMLLQSFADLVRTIDGMIAGVVGSLWALLALGFLVAAFGVVNTLTMNVMEQTREFGLLRAVAMTQAQVAKTIFSQAALLASAGLLPATVAGLAIAWLINYATFSVIGHDVAFGFYPLMIIGTFIGATIIILVAAWIPARRAARLDLTQSLQYE